jgi:hypothetical protein
LIDVARVTDQAPEARIAALAPAVSAHQGKHSTPLASGFIALYVSNQSFNRSAIDWIAHVAKRTIQKKKQSP